MTVVLRSALSAGTDLADRARAAGRSSDRRCGGRVRRCGVRSRRGRQVVRSASAGPAPQRTLAEVLAVVGGQAVGVRAIAASHRVGTLLIGDAALVAAVSADHRGAAFETCARLVDAVKERLPVWKRPVLHRRHRRMGQLGLKFNQRPLHEHRVRVAVGADWIRDEASGGRQRHQRRVAGCCGRIAGGGCNRTSGVFGAGGPTGAGACAVSGRWAMASSRASLPLISWV